MKDYISEPARPVFESGAPPKPLIASAHPYRDELRYQPDLFWTWHWSTWSEDEKAARQKATKRDILGLFDEIAELRERLAEVAQRPVSARHEAPPDTMAGDHVIVPDLIRRNLRRRARRG